MPLGKNSDERRKALVALVGPTSAIISAS